MANACNHLKVKDIPKNADGTWPRICHHCFKRISFSSPGILIGGIDEGENFVGMVEGKREISSSPSEGENFVGMVEGKREISSSPSEGENFVGMVEGKREISSSPSEGGSGSPRGGSHWRDCTCAHGCKLECGR